MLLTTIRSTFAFDCTARCVIKICLQLFSLLLCVCATIIALEKLYSSWATDPQFGYQLGHMFEMLRTPALDDSFLLALPSLVLIYCIGTILSEKPRPARTPLIEICNKLRFAIV